MLAADAVAGSASNATLKVLAASHPLMADSIPGAGYRRWPAAVSMGSTGAVLGLRRAGKDARTQPARPSPKGAPMPTFVLLSTLTPEGVQTIKNNPSRIREVNKEIEQLGATVKAQWATLGRFDFVNIVEADDEKAIARVSLELGSRGTAKYETLAAIPVEDFISSL